MGKKSVAISEETHKQLIKVKSILDLKHNKIHSMNEVISFLIGVYRD